MSEVIEIQNLLGKKLVGDFYQAKSKKAVVLVHGFLSGRKRSGKYVDLAKKLVDMNINVFSFDLSGYGDSDEEEISVRSGVLDLKCILAYIRYKGYEKIGVCGHSLGSLITLRQNLKKIHSICLMAGVTDKISYSYEDRFGPEKMKQADELGYFTVTNRHGGRDFKVSSKMRDERYEVSQDELLSDVELPVYLVHGRDDNVIPYQNSQKAYDKLKGVKRIDIWDNEGHNLKGNIDKINEKICEWFVKTL